MRGSLVAHYQPLGRRLREDDKRCEQSGKRSFPTEDDALMAAFEFASANRFQMTSGCAYTCRHCGRWHLTSKAHRKAED